MTLMDDRPEDTPEGVTPPTSEPNTATRREVSRVDPNDDDREDHEEDDREHDAHRGAPSPRHEPMHETPAVLVRMRVPGNTAACDPGSVAVKLHDRVVIDCDQGQVVGTVIRALQPTLVDRPLGRVLRRLDPDDARIIQQNRVREREAFQFCVERIKARNLPMKLLSVDLAHSGTRAIFYFSSAERVDFRSLVKDLARRFHTRIEMRQVGVRDGARQTGGMGLCGRELCCATWLTAFQPISIRMAKDQNLALNHQKLSGLCGRLRCCLDYEEALYQELRKGLPKVGKRVLTPQGEGRVKDVDVLRRVVRVQLSEGGYAQFGADDVKRPADLQAPAIPPAHPQAALPPPSPPPPRTVETPAENPLTDDAETDNEGPGEDASTATTASPPGTPGAAGVRTGRRRRRRRGRRNRQGGTGPDSGGTPPSSTGSNS